MKHAAVLSASLIAAPILAAIALPESPAMAQTHMSSAQIIQSLAPTGNLLQGHPRGIRMLNPGATSRHATHGASASVARPDSANAVARSVSLSVEFATGSAELTPRAQQTLDELGKALTSDALSRYRFRVEGHTDTVGTPMYNRALSEQRAAAVARYLETRFGMQSARLDPVGMGEEGLAVPTPPNTPNERNRRVHVVNLGA